MGVRDSTEMKRLAADLRKAADWLERLPEVEGYCFANLHLGDLSKADLAIVARHMGKATKQENGAYYWLGGEIAGIEISAFAKSREEVCRKVVKGTRQIPRKVIPAHEEEIVEWICDEPLLAVKAPPSADGFPQSWKAAGRGHDGVDEHEVS